MKYLKMLGLAAIAALAFAAIAGAGTASAAKLCKTAPNKSGVCEGGHYASGTTFEATSTNPVLTVVSGATSQVTCSHSTVSLKSTATEGTPGVPGEITHLGFTGCKTALGFSCTVSTTSGYTGELTSTTLTAKGSAETSVVCAGFLSCKYKPKAAGVSLSFTAGNPAKFTATEQELELIAGGEGCGTGAKWDATYTLTSPTALWVSAS
jgi:hypothetical protein